VTYDIVLVMKDFLDRRPELVETNSHRSRLGVTSVLYRILDFGVETKLGIESDTTSKELGIKRDRKNIPEEEVEQSRGFVEGLNDEN